MGLLSSPKWNRFQYTVHAFESKAWNAIIWKSDETFGSIWKKHMLIAYPTIKLNFTKWLMSLGVCEEGALHFISRAICLCTSKLMRVCMYVPLWMCMIMSLCVWVCVCAHAFSCGCINHVYGGQRSTSDSTSEEPDILFYETGSLTWPRASCFG